MKKILCSVCALALVATAVFCFSGCTNDPTVENPSEAESISAEA